MRPNRPNPTQQAQQANRPMRPTGYEARIWAGWLGFGPTGWDIGQQAEVWASRLRFGPEVLEGDVHMYVQIDGQM